MSAHTDDAVAFAAFIAKFEDWSRALLAQPRSWQPGITRMADVQAACAAIYEARNALPLPAVIHGLYPGFEALGGAWAAADADGGGILMAVADMAAREASEAANGRALNWQSALHLYGAPILQPMLDLLRQAAETGGEYWCRWERSEQPCDADGEPIEGADEIVTHFPVGPDLPDGLPDEAEEARLTICTETDQHATRVKQLWFDIEDLQDVMEQREKLADAARRGEVADNG